MPKLFAGLDVADRTTAICILDRAGKLILETSAPTQPATIAKALRPYRRFLVNVGQESGTKANWLHKELLLRSFPMVCLDARYVRAALAARPNKTDKNDARGIATVLRRGLFTTAFVKSDEALRIRLLLTTRKNLQRKALDLQASVRMSLKTFGAHLQTGRRRSIVQQKGKAPDEMFSRLIEVMLESSNRLLNEVATLDRLVTTLAKNDAVCRRLMTIPGVGPITALTFRAAVDDPARFKSSRTVAAYFGLTPRLFQSGQTSLSGHISRHGDSSVRTALYSAACVLLSTSRSQWTLRLWGLRLAERKGYRVAAVACARRLAVVMHRIWISGRTFEAARKDEHAPEADGRPKHL